MNNQLILNIKNISHKYKKSFTLENINFQIFKGEIISILGPSGSGKSTLLKIISGIEKIKSGEVFLENKVLTSASIHVEPNKRDVGLVFQDLALFPHLNIEDNIKYGISNLSKSEKLRRVNEMLKLIKMLEYSFIYPHALSGGQQQRVALARALAPMPKVLLLDEPFSGLDVNLRRDILQETVYILKKYQITSIFVTHDANDALMISDKIIVLNNGKIEQFDTPKNIYNKPKNSFVASFFGVINRIKVTEIIIKNFMILEKLLPNKKDVNTIFLYFRPESIKIRQLDTHKEFLYFEANILNFQYFGSYILVHFCSKEFGNVIGKFSPQEEIKIGDSLYLEIDICNIFCFED
nr:hypothetical protein GTC16762_18810 [Pigmentibacter ruber]